MIRCLLYWEVHPAAVAEVGEETFMLIADTMARNEADRRRVKLAARQETLAEDGVHRVLVWPIDEGDE